jgi:hypothetical protein
MPTGDALCLTSFFSYVVECTAFHCTYALGGFLYIVMSRGSHCFGSGSVLDPDSIRSVDPDPDPGGQKLPTKIEKMKKFHVEKCWMFFFEG